MTIVKTFSSEEDANEFLKESNKVLSKSQSAWRDAYLELRSLLRRKDSRNIHFTDQELDFCIQKAGNKDIEMLSLVMEYLENTGRDLWGYSRRKAEAE